MSAPAKQQPQSLVVSGAGRSRSTKRQSAYLVYCLQAKNAKKATKHEFITTAKPLAGAALKTKAKC